jgi:RNA polymerase primary sigma factor
MKPEERKQAAVRLVGSGIPKALGTEGTRRLQQILSERIDYVDDPSFAQGPAFGTHSGWGTRSSLKPSRRQATRASGQATHPIAGKTLTRSEERQLFLRFNYARYRVAGILKSFADKPLTTKAAKELLEWHTESSAARDLLVESNMPLVLAMAKRSRLSNVDFTDLISEGNLALLRSVRNFDCSRGYRFSTYACRAILTSFGRAVEQTSRYRARFPIQLDPRLGKVNHHATEDPDGDRELVDQIRNILHENSAQLNEIETTVIRARFPVTPADSATTDTPKTLEQVGLLIGVTKERVRQIQNQALAKLRLKLLEKAVRR